MIRYLICLRVNSSNVFIPRYLPLDISMVIGSIIMDRLSTKDKGVWQKKLQPLVECLQTKNPSKSNIIPEKTWPIEAIIFANLPKKTFGREEFIIWELKLFGDAADHGYFLEVILPAIEEASYTSKVEWNKTNRLWGHYDIHNVYTAKGNKWEPLVESGKLNLRYRVQPNQWLDQLSFSQPSDISYKHCQWITPFSLTDIPASVKKLTPHPSFKSAKIPNAVDIILALVYRLHQLLPTKTNKIFSAEALFNPDELDNIKAILKIASQVSKKQSKMTRVPITYPGHWIGKQNFSAIPNELIPYFELASIFHIGKFTQYGCGTFQLSD